MTDVLRGRIAEAVSRGPSSTLRTDDVLVFLEAYALDATQYDDRRLDDIVLARACARGSPSAVDKFVSTHQELLRAVGVQSMRPDERDDFQQHVLTHLLVQQGNTAPRVEQYRGRGTLRAFVRMVASRLAIDLKRARGNESTASDLGAWIVEELDPDEALESAEVRTMVSEALIRALRGLKPPERRALRMRYVLGFSVARTAEALGIHEISVSRLVTRVRTRLLQQVRDELSRGDTSVEPGVLAALARTLDVSLARWLQTNID